MYKISLFQFNFTISTNIQKYRQQFRLTEIKGRLSLGHFCNPCDALVYFRLQKLRQIIGKRQSGLNVSKPLGFFKLTSTILRSKILLL